MRRTEALSSNHDATSATATLFSGALGVMVLLAGCAASQPSASRTPTPTQESTASPTPTGPTVAFEGDCHEVTAASALSELTGHEMTLAEPGWVVDDAGRLGGVDCLWMSEVMGLHATVAVEVFPISSVPDDMRVAEATSGCPETYLCRAAAESESMWVSVRTTGEGAEKESAEQVRDEVLVTLESMDTPVPSSDRDGWWSALACGDLQTPDGWTATAPTTGEGLTPSVADAAGMRTICELQGTVSGEPIGTSVFFHPGGAPDIESAAAVAEARDITVEGAARAVATIDPDRIEPLDDRLVVSDGTNELIVQVPLGFTPEDFAPLASSLLGAMGD